MTRYIFKWSIWIMDWINLSKCMSPLNNLTREHFFLLKHSHIWVKEIITSENAITFFWLVQPTVV